MKPRFQLSYKHVIPICIFFALITIVQNATCTRQRCCLSDPCTTTYCQQKNSQSWISTQNFANYQYTKLVLSTNQCKPCPYDCKSGSSENSCTQCAKGFYLDSTTSKCLLCSDRCNTCTVVNSITKCSSCQDGSYLDTNTLTCKSCPTGAKTCSGSTAIIDCLSGYKKSSNSLYCTTCPSNCLSCPVSDTVCASCATGYYLNSNACVICSISNCQTCLKVSSTISCTKCTSGYLLKTGACVACPSNCKTCSSATVCTTCNSGYYVIGGACSPVTTSVSNCDVYSSSVACSTCTSGFYLTNSLCNPCSLLCATCDGSHFGQCLSCNSNSVLFNKMCLINNFPSTSTYNLFYSFPQSSGLLSAGTLSCSNQYATGQTITLNLNYLKAYKLEISWKVYSISGSTTYSVAVVNSGGTTVSTYSTSSTLKYSNLCTDNSTSVNYNLGVQKTVVFNSIKKLNTLAFSTDNGVTLALHEIVITAYRCNDLCIECSSTLCTECLMTKLYTQDAYCVYTCSNNYYIYLNPSSLTNPKQCLADCPIGTFTLTSNVSCAACTAPCLSCLNENFCLSCVDGYYLTKQNTCKQTCPYKYYGKVQTKTCQKCVGRCLQCISEQKCLSCTQGFLYNTTSACIDSCDKGTTTVDGIYADLTTLYCEICDSTCLNCLYQKTLCSQCISTKYLYNSQCLPSCPTQYYAPTKTNVCSACQYPCKTCQVNSTACTSCLQGYLFGLTCVNDCSTGYYEDNVNLVCSSCDSKCYECYGSSTYCLSCKPIYLYYQDKCYSSCSNGFYPAISTNTSIGNTCTSCVSLCNTCLNQTYCLSCKSNFLYQGNCVSSGECPSGYFAAISTLSCLKCSTPCLQCQYTSTHCTKCNLTNTNGLIYLEKKTCVTGCSSQYFYSKVNSTVATCLPCEQPCMKCLSASLCLSCITGYKYSNNVCSSTCSIGTFFDSSINDCSNCSASCQICTSTLFCQSCNSAFYISSISSTQNQCVSACPLQFYAQSLTSSCQKCIYPCNTCSSSIDCLTCISGFLYQSRCISSCPDSTYLNIATNQCVSCQGNCMTCSNDPTYCQSCKDGFYLVFQTHTCISVCPALYYAQTLTKSCLACPTTCSSCINSTYCTGCIMGKSYKSTQTNICVTYCPSKFYGKDTTLSCKSCNSNCLTCKNSASNCLSCSTGYLFIKLTYDTNDCQVACPTGYYAESSYCYACSFPCQTCTSPSKCLSCFSGTFYHKPSDSCLLACPAQTFYNYTGLSCDSCTYPCKACDNNATYCLSCSNSLNGSNMYLFNGACVSTCLSGYYADQSGICNKCYGFCSTCQSKYTCLTCLAGYVYDGFCYSSCPLGTYANTTVNACQNCDPVCSQCVLTSNYCTKCSGGLYVYKGACSTNCPTGTYEDNGKCQTCTFPCVNCNNQNTCNECLGGYLLYMNISCIKDVSVCPNDFYKMNSKYCVPVTWCPSNYFIDQTQKTCSTSCDRKKYTNLATKKCQSSCLAGWYAGVNLVCQQWSSNPPISLMGMSAISYIKSSYLYIEIVFNETVTWIDVSTGMYTFSLVESRRLLLFSQYSVPQYTTTLENPTSLKLKPSTYPQRVNINLEGYRVKSASTNYPHQNPSISLNLPTFTHYNSSQIYSGTIMGQFSQGICWFIILLSFFFLFKNRLSDLYVLWDVVQLLYLLIFLDIQYPPNLNEFYKGLKFTHFTFLPSIFTSSNDRNKSDAPFYAYSFDNSFLRNTGGLFLALIIVFGFLILLKFLSLLIRKLQFVRQKAKKYPSVKGFIYAGILRYRWHHISDVMFLTYALMTLFAFSQINYISKNPNNTFSNVLAILTILAYTIWVIFVGYKLFKHFKNISKGKLVNNLKCFYRGIQKENKFGIALVLIRYARKLFYSLVISVFSANPMFALPILMFTSVLMCLFLVINLPYKKKLSNMITIGSEIVLVLMYLLVALINFNNQTFSASMKHSFGWICCILLALMIFALVYEVFCKTMFYLQPQVNPQQALKDENQQKMLNNKDRQYLRKKAEQFFDSLLPRLRERLNFDQDSDDQMYKNYEEGDSQNSQNNQEIEKNWNDGQSHNSDEFKHYDNSESNFEDPTALNSKAKINQAPQYLVRCVKDIQ